MKRLAAFFLLTALAPLAQAEEVWRWKDQNGTLCYSNRAEVKPPEATPVKTRLIVEADALPGADLVMDDGVVTEARERRREPQPPQRRLRPIYTERRLRFDCFAGSVLFSGGWAHPDDVTVVGNCLPYLLGPQAWLNGARAELGLREHGIDWRQLIPMYTAQQEWIVPPRLATVSGKD